MKDQPADDRDRVLAAFRAATSRFLVLLQSLEPGEIQLCVPDLDWTVGETAAHVLSLYRRLTGDVRRGADRNGVAVLNTETNAEIGTDTVAIGAEINELGTQVCELASAIALDAEFPFHADVSVTYAEGIAVVVGELAVHGDDIARATGRPWEIEPEDLLLAWQFAGKILDAWLRPGAADGIDESWALNIAGEANPIVMRVAEGRLTVDGDMTIVADHVVEITDLVEFGLGFPYRRRPVHPGVAKLATLFEPA